MFTGRVPFTHALVPRVPVLIVQGIRPERPATATPLGLSDEVWDLMETCWRADWRKRPRIRRVLGALRINLQRHEALDVVPCAWPLPDEDHAANQGTMEVDSESDRTIRLPGQSHDCVAVLT